MRGIVLSLVLVTAGFSAALPVFGDAPVASACSCGDCDFVRDAEVVVRGMFVGWDYERGSNGLPLEVAVDWPAFERPEWRPGARPVVFTFEVADVFKGEAPPNIVIFGNRYDRYLRAEGSPVFGYWAWPSEAGVCFGLAGDPSGQDALAILKPDSAGRLRLVVAPVPFSEASLRSRYASLGPPHPPSAGDSRSDAPAQPATDDWMFLSAIGAGFLLITLVLVLIGPVRNARHPD